MNQIKLVKSDIVKCHKSELPQEDQKLIKLAESACDTAYAPYSQFIVGAAILLKNDKTVIGSNQENAAYPSGLCAERVALFNAATNHKGVKIKKIAVTARRYEDQEFIEVSPCGSCRQVMLEYEYSQGHNIKILFATEGGWVQVPSTSILLPFGFNKNSL